MRKKDQKKPKAINPDSVVEYKQITAEIFFTDGEVETVNFENLDDFTQYLNKTARIQFVDSIRAELF